LTDFLEITMVRQEGQVTGAILAQDVPAALGRLTAAIEAAKDSPPVADTETQDEPAVSLANRALPLINLLAAAAKSNSQVMWK
jgi:hypothetical protein